ncbi:GFA family protein [Pseudoblastomonas halimionae]|uniref:GFA family protein n=1 Tax=Alteriqipengyuania halimionae TaxID=1926630 RepID=A0A6I4U2D9_9SPHN|nr:GFA family protein [Alteriqipengyuania halimionae]MXP10239.1 GFA family protein [Alteriqipengyuania halimionae]
MKRTYHGSCHCKAVTFEVDLDLASGTGKCNCTFCRKQRMWKAAPVKPDAFRLLTGKDTLVDYGSSGDGGEQQHHFCKICGIATHNDGSLPMLGGKFVMVHVAALDDLSPRELLAAPMRCADGLNDAWENEPEEVRHL